MPAAAWAARSGDPVLFTGRKNLPKPTAGGPAPPPEGPGLRARALLGDLLRGPAQKSPRSAPGCAASPARTRSRTRSPSPATTTADFGWNVNDPGHGFVVARSDEPLDAAAAAPLSASGTWGPLLLTDDAGTLPAALRGYLLDVKPGYTEDPTRAFYNHVWVIGDQEAIEVGQQAEIDGLAELAKIGGEAMSEAENPELLGGAAEVTRRGHPRPCRRRHPAFRPPGPQPDPATDRAAPGRPPGAGRRRAQDRRARGARRAQRRAARDDRDRPGIEEPRPGRLAARRSSRGR